MTSSTDVSDLKEATAAATLSGVPTAAYVKISSMCAACGEARTASTCSSVSSRPPFENRWRTNIRRRRWNCRCASSSVSAQTTPMAAIAYGASRFRDGLNRSR